SAPLHRVLRKARVRSAAVCSDRWSGEPAPARWLDARRICSLRAARCASSAAGARRRDQNGHPRLRPDLTASKLTAVTRPFLSLLVFAWIASACAPELGVGTAACIGSAPLRIPEDASDPVSSRDPVDAWETDFENGFCDFRFARGGFCYASPDAAYELVTSPVRSGQRAAAFSVTTDPDLDGEQARCVREGALPAAAYYGAWY